MNQKPENMRRTILVLLAVLLLTLSALTACSRKAAPNAAKVNEIDGQPWDTTVPVELTDEVREMLTKAENGTNYTPVAVLGKQEGTYCVLCKETGVSGAPKNVLVYVNGDGIQNTYELWIEKHGTKGN